MASENWMEIDVAEKENRRELVLSGPNISKRIENASGEIDPRLYLLIKLNFLEISKTSLQHISPSISGLKNMTNLILQQNKLKVIPSSINELKKLKIFDISHNQLEELPLEIGELHELHSFFVGSNKLTNFPNISQLSNLHEIDVSHNKLTLLPAGITSQSLALLNKVSASGNEITTLPIELYELPALKVLNVFDNRLTVIPSELSQCQKLHVFDYGGNKLSDKRLARMMDQCSTKSVLDYLRRIYDKEHVQEGGKGKKNKKGKRKKDHDSEDDLCEDLIKVLHFSETSCTVQITSRVADVRPYIVCCIVRGLDLHKSFKQFIAFQTRLHDGICQKRQAATIATHDMSAVNAPLLYDAQRPDLMQLIPLFKNKAVSGQKLVGKLRQEAEEFRKEKKKNTLSGIHKYLDLLKGKTLYPCLIDAEGEIVSFPPITNCDKTKISQETTDILIEVTSSNSLDTCKKVVEAVLEGMLDMGLGQMQSQVSACNATDEDGDDGISFGGAAHGDASVKKSNKELVVEQVRILDEEGIMKVVFPARNDLLLSNSYKVIRDYE